MTNYKLKQALTAFLAFLMIGASGIALAGCNNTDNKDNEDTSQHGDNDDTDGDVIEEVVKLEFENKYYEYFQFDAKDPETTFYDKPCMVFMYNGPTDEYKAVKNGQKVISEIDLENLTEEEKQTLKDLGFNGSFVFTNEILVPEKNGLYGGITWYDISPNGSRGGTAHHAAIEQYLEDKHVYGENIGFVETWVIKELKDLSRGSFMDFVIANFPYYNIISLDEYKSSNLIGIGLSDKDKTDEEKQIENQSANTNSTSIPYVPGARERNYNPEYGKKYHK